MMSNASSGGLVQMSQFSIQSRESSEDSISQLALNQSYQMQQPSGDLLGGQGIWQPVPGRNKHLVKVNTQNRFGGSSSLDKYQGGAVNQAQTSKLIERIQQKFSIKKETMNKHFIPELQNQWTEAQLDAELARIKKKQRKAALRSNGYQKKSLEAKYPGLVLNLSLIHI